MAEDAVLCSAGRTPVRNRKRPDAEEFVRTLTFTCDGGISAFAFSNGSFRFGEPDGERGALNFSDASGTYEASFARVIFLPGHEHAGTLVWNEEDGFPRVAGREP